MSEMCPKWVRVGVFPRHVPCSAQLGTETSSLSCAAHLYSTLPYKYLLDHGIFSCHLHPCCTPLTMSSCSRSSSLTITSTSSAPTSPACSSTTTILQDEQPAIKLETERDAARFEFYRGDDLKDPPAKNNSFAPPLPFLPKPNNDPNVVTWDSPEDPENPKNWSFWYRWCITIACTVMTLNVCVPPDRADLSSSYTD